MVKLFNISDWNEQSWWNTGGTRDKKIYLNPDDNEIYYFKQSFKKGQRDYKHEFWSEIIASQVGNLLGFNLLDYHIAVRDEVIGCISKSMISDEEELVEGRQYLQAFDHTFNPENVKLRHQYNFDLIKNALGDFEKQEYLEELIKIIVFDALIGNSDRHQENWALINVRNAMSETFKEIKNEISENKAEDSDKLNLLRKIIKAFNLKKEKVDPFVKKAGLMFYNKTRFAPIYDSGCSFGRELSDERIGELLSDDMEINKYILKGKAEIHWGKKKLCHFELIEAIIKDKEFKSHILNAIELIVNNFNSDIVKSTITDIDKVLYGNDYKKYILPVERKSFIIKLLDLRFNKLKEIFNQNK